MFIRIYHATDTSTKQFQCLVMKRNEFSSMFFGRKKYFLIVTCYDSRRGDKYKESIYKENINEK